MWGGGERGVGGVEINTRLPNTMELQYNTTHHSENLSIVNRRKEAELAVG